MDAVDHDMHMWMRAVLVGDDERPVLVEGGAYPLGERGVLPSLRGLGQLVEPTADVGQLAEQGIGGSIVPRPRDRAERRLADEARRCPAAGAGAGGDTRQLLGAEADQFGGGAALGHLRLAGTAGR